MLNHLEDSRARLSSALVLPDTTRAGAILGGGEDRR